ncbi:hypothetical protein PIB30_035099 [Stylosanthes scabra]|uniref:Uncharacterized protein n=1 Tax=Stylosanthes scabra TaxID=79078 RepID=A0ABU6RD44_9FABA|nr:hypothetical protein [Stylosanthes scabra]
MSLTANPRRRQKFRSCIHPSWRRRQVLLVMVSTASSSPSAVAVPAGHPWRESKFFLEDWPNKYKT